MAWRSAFSLEFGVSFDDLLGRQVVYLSGQLFFDTRHHSNPLASCLPQLYRKDCIADYHVLFALAYWRAYCIGILFDLARARLYIISIKMPIVAHRLPYLLLGSGILDHTLLMADAYYNKYENLHTRDDRMRELDDHNRNRIYNTHNLSYESRLIIGGDSST